MRIVIHPKYEFLRAWLEQLPATFEQQGEVIYEERNQMESSIPCFVSRRLYGHTRMLQN